MGVTQYFCGKLQRKASVKAAVNAASQHVLNGIDYLEVVSSDEKTLAVHFLFNLPGAPNQVPPSPASSLTTQDISIEGGTRIVGIQVMSVSVAANVLTVQVDAAGDYSIYTLRVGATQGFDPQLSEVAFSFKVECPSDFDCKPVHNCPPEPFPAADINYLAKDYSSFRQLILDRMARTMPGWRERNPADVGVVLVELLAYAGDQLSYYQDAVATEAYLGTARRRVSIRRHAKLLDYNVTEGCNARTWVFFKSAPGLPVSVPGGSVLLTRAPLARGPISQDQAQSALSFGFSNEKVGEPLDLRQIELPVLKGTAGEGTGFGGLQPQ